MAEKQLLRGDEQVRVLQAKKAKAEDPRALWETAKAQGIPLVPPEFKEEATTVKKKG